MELFCKILSNFARLLNFIRFNPIKSHPLYISCAINIDFLFLPFLRIKFNIFLLFFIESL